MLRKLLISRARPGEESNFNTRTSNSCHCTYLLAPCVPLCHVSPPLLDLPFHHHLLLKWKMKEWSSSNNNTAHPPQDMVVNMVGIHSSAQRLPYDSDVTMCIQALMDWTLREREDTPSISCHSLFSTLLGEVIEMDVTAH